MRDTLVLTVLGRDRTGLVGALADRIAAVGGNWEASHMARLAGQFAGILQVTVEHERVESLLAALRGVDKHGLEVMVRATEVPPAPEGTRIRLDLTGDDRPGIVQAVSRALAERGANVEEFESEVGSAPMSGEALFRARIVLNLPTGVELADVRADLEAVAGELMVALVPADG